ncbi:MAG TPA: hypothetical protein VJT49_16700 [Amycolatopsis sp.]|uniref:hypothetical protein n=1 Tax=Amycolatopsis sp. TaxID=37632 RepID=UPI002B4970B0|nr:hypothetical protein [Amycolatopsis sp.]HKS46714.1 hypothetical protein [Amycolatopsis sp.]
MDAEDAVQWIDRTPTLALTRSGRPLSVYGGLIVPQHDSDLALYVPGEFALLSLGGWDELIAALTSVREAKEACDRGRQE